MANKLVLPLLLALVLGFGITTAMAFQGAASLFDDATTVLSHKRPATVSAPAAEQDAAPTLVASLSR